MYKSIILRQQKIISHRMRENVSNHLISDSYPENTLKTLTTQKF